MDIRIAGVVEESIVDGPGLRFVIFTQGCPHRCAGCHNPHTHDFEGGSLADTDELYHRCRHNPMHSGVTLSGGEPFCQPAPLAALCERFRADGLSVMAYSGYTFEELFEMAKQDADTDRLLRLCDILVDGRFEQGSKSLLLRFRGSANQRILDLPASLAAGRAVEKEL